MWKQKAAQVIPIVISSTGVIPKSISQSLICIHLHPNAYIHCVYSVEILLMMDSGHVRNM